MSGTWKSLGTPFREPCYLIVGGGFAAAANHLTLKPARMAGLEIIHIGMPDPWSNYCDLPMGQWPHALRIPGGQPQPPAGLSAFLQSACFARTTRDEYARLA